MTNKSFDGIILSPRSRPMKVIVHAAKEVAKRSKMATAVLGIAALVLGGFASFTPRDSVAATTWDVSGSYVVAFTCTAGCAGVHPHDMTLTQDGSNNLTGSGGSPAGGPHVYTWVVDPGSNVVDDTITVVARYTATPDAVTPQTIMNMTGAIATDGTMSGTWDDNYNGGSRSGTWETTSGAAVEEETNTTVVVSPGNMQGWGFVQETPTGSGAMVAGPGTPPEGTGSANLIVDSTGGEILAAPEYAGTRLDEFTTLEYSTYRTSGGPALAIALQFNFDGDVTDANDAFQGRIVYEPYHTQTVSTGVWETWDAMNDAAGTGTGNWWFSNGTHATTSGCTMATPCTWAEVLTAFPNGGVHNTLGAVILKAGSGWAGGFNGNVDALVIGVGSETTTYDFELEDVEDQGPITSNVVLTDTTLTATVDDSTTGGANIQSAEYTIDGGTASPMTASDLAFDEVSEDVTATIAALEPGSHEICVTGTDANGNIGEPTCITVEIGFPTPVTKDDCKNDGWMTLTDADGNPFKNQGQCVSSVAKQQNDPEPLSLSVMTASASTISTAPGQNKLQCFSGSTDYPGIYNGTCTLQGNGAKGPATLNNVDADADPYNNYSGVYLLTSNLDGAKVADVKQLSFNYSGDAATAGSPRIAIPVDLDGTGGTDGYLFISAFYCNDDAGLVDVVNDATCTIYTNFSGDSWENLAAFKAAYPNAVITSDSDNAFSFIVADDPGTWTVSNVKLGKGGK